MLAAAKAGAAGGEADGAGDGGKIVALQSEITSLTSQLNTVSLRQAKDAATVFVDAELKRGNTVAKPLRGHYIAMHMQDPGRVEKELRAMPALGPSGMQGAPPEAGGGKISLNAAQIAVAAQLGIDPKDYAETLAETLTEEAL